MKNDDDDDDDDALQSLGRRLFKQETESEIAALKTALITAKLAVMDEDIKGAL